MVSSQKYADLHLNYHSPSSLFNLKPVLFKQSKYFSVILSQSWMMLHSTQMILFLRNSLSFHNRFLHPASWIKCGSKLVLDTFRISSAERVPGECGQSRYIADVFHKDICRARSDILSIYFTKIYCRASPDNWGYISRCQKLAEASRSIKEAHRLWWQKQLERKF